MRVRRVGFEPGRGIVVLLRRGPDLIFGDSRRVQAKWAAAVRVLLAPEARGAGYVDVRLPDSPAAGPADPDPEPVAGQGASGTGSTATAGPAGVADGMEGAALPPAPSATVPPDAGAPAPDQAGTATAAP